MAYYDGYYVTAEAAETSGDPTRTWVFATDEDGRIYLTAEYYVSGDSLYYSSEGHSTLPLGTYVIRETKAPEGYNLNGEVFVRQVTGEGTMETVETYNTPEVPDKVKRGDVAETNGA